MNTLHTWLAAPWVETLGQTLLHFIWEGAVLSALAWVTLRLAHKRSAHVRYLLAGLLMLALPVASVVTFLVLAKTPKTPVPVVKAVTGLPDNVAMAAGPVVLPVQNLAMPKPVTVMPPNSSPTGVTVTNKSAWRAEVIAACARWIVPFWLVGILIMGLRLGLGWLRIQLWRRSAVVAVDAALLASFKRLAEKFKLGAKVRLLISEKIPGPVTLGWVKPAVLLPATMLTGLPPELLEALLAHELAHIARQDYLLNLVQSAIEVFLFYHPAVWWLGSQLREIREECCDDLAVHACGDRLTYARALESLAELQLSAEPAAAATGGNLLARISRIVGRAPEASGSSALGTLLFLFAVGGFIACLSVSSSKAQDQTPPPIQNKTTDNKKVTVVGEVITPLAFAINADSPKTLSQAITQAGLTRWSIHTVQLMRLDQAGKKTTVDINVDEVLVKGDKSKDMVLQPGDIILVKKAWLSFGGAAIPPDPNSRKAEAEKLIDELVNVSTPMPNINTGEVSPFPTVMHQLYEMSVDAVPALLDHLTDARKTKLVIKNPGTMPETSPVYGRVYFGSMMFFDEYDSRYSDPAQVPANVNTVKLGRNRISLGDSIMDSYTVPVGDLCFVLLGEIVNRNLVAVRYQPSGSAVINSPVHTPALAAAARQDWTGLTVEQLRSMFSGHSADMENSYPEPAKTAPAAVTNAQQWNGNFTFRAATPEETQARAASIIKKDALTGEELPGAGPAPPPLVLYSNNSSNPANKNAPTSMTLPPGGLIWAGSPAPAGTGNLNLSTGTAPAPDTLVVAGSNTYTGGTTVGTLTFSGPIPAPAAQTPSQHPAYNYEGTFEDKSAAPAPVQWNGNFTFVGTSNLNLGTDQVRPGSYPATISASDNSPQKKALVTTSALTTGGGFILNKNGTGASFFGLPAPVQQLPGSLQFLTKDALTGEKLFVPRVDVKWSANNRFEPTSPSTTETVVQNGETYLRTSTASYRMLNSRDPSTPPPVPDPSVRTEMTIQVPTELKVNHSIAGIKGIVVKADDKSSAPAQITVGKNMSLQVFSDRRVYPVGAKYIEHSGAINVGGFRKPFSILSACPLTQWLAPDTVVDWKGQQPYVVEFEYCLFESPGWVTTAATNIDEALTMHKDIRVLWRKTLTITVDAKTAGTAL